jgi:poly(U)-specific endoribonuclease
MSLSDAVQCCWRLDSNRLRPGADYKINVQQGKKPFWKEDKAPDPLFEYVSDAVWKSRPTYRALQHLLDHYHAETGRAEHMNDRWRSDMDAFVDAITETAVMQFCHRYCVVHRGGQNVPNDTAGFQKLLKTVWLELYNRTKGGPKDSSGFEHVFCGEVRDGKISGFHNWVRFYLEERKGTSVLDYRGYIKPKSHGDAPSDSDDHVLTLQFVHNGATKELGTMFIGTSPEFEIAAYTICFLCGASNSGTNGSNLIRLNTGTDVFELEIVCHKIHGNRVGSCYPYVKSHHEA